MKFACNLYLKQISFLYIQTLHNDCSHIEDVQRRGRSRAEFGLVCGLLSNVSCAYMSWPEAVHVL